MPLCSHSVPKVSIILPFKIKFGRGRRRDAPAQPVFPWFGPPPSTATNPIPSPTPDNHIPGESTGASEAYKPIEKTPDPSNIPELSADDAAKALTAIIDHSATEVDVAGSLDMHAQHLLDFSWVHRLIPGLEKLAAEYHLGNYFVIRETGERVFESMPIYAR